MTDRTENILVWGAVTLMGLYGLGSAIYYFWRSL